MMTIIDNLPPMFREFIYFVFIVAIAILAAKFLVPFVFRLIKRFTKRTVTEFDDRIIVLSEVPLKLLVLLVGIYIALGRIPFSARVKLIIDGILFVFAVYVLLRLVILGGI